MNDISIIGAGITGLEAARNLAQKGYRVVVLERDAQLGGHVAQWHELYPFGRNGYLILKELGEEALFCGAKILTNADVVSITRQGDCFLLTLSDGQVVESLSVLVANGFSLFDARLKEELGYGLYPGVLTASDLEGCWMRGEDPFEQKQAPVFGIVHCVGSRDLKCGNNYCSKVCCMVAVKTAIALKKRYPGCQVTNFYMDLRMFDHGYEELYHSAQLDYGVQFVRGRVSEVSPEQHGRLRVKAEDTLLGLPVQLLADGVVLMTGMQPNDGIAFDFNLQRNNMHFLSGLSELLCGNATLEPGLFIAGSCKGPMTLTESVADARSSVLAIEEFLN